ncbi:MAG TPA: MFS transporter [Trebonia sp.]|jgi:MFS family permease|nr:MFS transporter [Trebonia sp.]
MRTYTEVFRAPEFTSLFATSSLQVAAATVGGLALGTSVYAQTGSPLLSALIMFGPSIAQIVGATSLLSAADRLPPRAAMAAVALLAGAGAAAQAIPGLPLSAIFAISVLLGVLTPLSSGARYGLLSEILPAEGRLLGRSVLNMSVGTLQICGFAVGGVLVTVLSSRGTLLFSAALWLLAAAGCQLGLRPRPARATGRPSLTATWRVNRVLWSSVRRRYVFLALWIPNGLIVGCEALFIAYSPRHAGLLYAFAALGMLIGDTLTGRFIPDSWRQRLGPWLRLLLAVPYLAFAVALPLPVAVTAITVASVGYAASLMLQERLVSFTPEELNGHAQGLQSAGMMAMQGVGAALAGTAAQLTSPATGMVIMAVASVGVTLLLAPGLRHEPQADPVPEPAITLLPPPPRRRRKAAGGAGHHGRLAGRPGP